jgi:hypothetical protein
MARINYLLPRFQRSRPSLESDPSVWAGVVLLLGILSLARFLFPLDIPFINDEALLLKKAWEANQAGGLTTHGLMGSRGVDYGPFPLWFYRAALFFSGSVLGVVLLKIFTTALFTSASLYFFARTCPFLNPWLAGVALLSPYLWFYGRDLWDNSFVIPLSAVALTSYAVFLERESKWALTTCVLAATLGFLTHLVFLPVCLGILFHLLVFRWRWLWISLKEDRRFLIALFVLAVVLAGPYVWHLLGQSPTQKLEPGEVGHALMPFTGPRFFTGFGLEYFLGKDWYSPFTGNVILNFFWVALLGFSLLGYPFVWFAILEAPVRLWKTRGEWDLEEEIDALMLLTFVFQIGLAWSYRLIPIPNFHSACWLVYFYFLWRTLTVVLERPIFRRLAGAYLVSLFTALIAMTTIIRLYGGNRELHHGPTLGNLLQVSRDIARYGTKTPLEVEAFHPREFPWSIEALLLFQKEKAQRPLSASKRLTLKYKTPSHTRDGRLELVETPKDRQGRE